MDRLGCLVVIAPARRAGDPGSIPDTGKIVSLKLLIYDPPFGYSEAKFSLKLAYMCR